MNKLDYTLKIEPMGAVRMTRRSKFVAKNAIRYLAYKQIIGASIKFQHEKHEPIPENVPVHVQITFYMPIPASWSNKKRLEHEGVEHLRKPDIDNLIKGLFDASNNLIWNDDNQVSSVSAVKKYSSEPGIKMTVMY